MAKLAKRHQETLLAILSKRPVFRAHPELLEACEAIKYKRFIGPPHLSPLEIDDAARLVGGAMALSQSDPPPNIVETINQVIDAGQTFLLICDKKEIINDIAEQVNTYRENRGDDGRWDLGPQDTAHRTLH